MALYELGLTGGRIGVADLCRGNITEKVTHLCSLLPLADILSFQSTEWEVDFAAQCWCTDVHHPSFHSVDVW